MHRLCQRRRRSVTKNFPDKSGLSLTLFLRLKKFRQRFRDILTTPFQSSKPRRTCGGKLRYRKFLS
jgi:phage baseplate assembly protein W